VRGYLKPISTLRRPLQSVDFATREPVKAAYERSDVCVVPAAGVAGEAMVALTLARCALDKFGGDSLKETKRNFQAIRTTEKLLNREDDSSHRKICDPVLDKPVRTHHQFWTKTSRSSSKTCSSPCTQPMALG